jgi:hypothetical protein
MGFPVLLGVFLMGGLPLLGVQRMVSMGVFCLGGSGLLGLLGTGVLLFFAGKQAGKANSQSKTMLAP